MAYNVENAVHLETDIMVFGPSGFFVGWRGKPAPSLMDSAEA